MVEQRLQKILASAGIDSRRKCEELILEGSVEVNGKVVDTLPVFADPDKDVIKVNGRKIRFEQKVYYLLNKPKGVICTNSDPEGRRKAIDLVPTDKRIFCIGRLDAETTGIIILTNDSELSNKLTHPKYGLPKKYVVELKEEISTEQIEKLKKGIWLAEGKTNKASIKIIKRNYKGSVVEISIKQGLNRQIRRMFAKVGLSVKSLKRTNIAKLDSKGLSVGRFRALTPKEVDYLKNMN